MPKAIKVQDFNVAYIIQYGANLEFDLSYIGDNMDYNAADGFETYLITDGSNEDRNVTFTAFAGPDFHAIWKFAEPEDKYHFTPIERV